MRLWLWPAPWKTWLMVDRLRQCFNLRRDEILPAGLAMLIFFCVLTALMVPRPAREALGLQGGIEAVLWLFMGTALVTPLLNPAFGFLVSRLPRLAFISASHLYE